MKYTIITALCLAAIGAAYFLFGTAQDEPDTTSTTPGAPIVTVALPETLSETAQIGERVFNENCAVCHGPNAAGQDGIAPPLVHKIYEPSHHGDESFQRAVALGVRGHHWPFGDMAPVEGLTRADVSMVIAYVRELQRANGIN